MLRRCSLAVPAAVVLLTVARAHEAELYEEKPYFQSCGDYERRYECEIGNLPPKACDPVVTSVGEYVTTIVDLALGGPMPLGFARHHGAFLGQAASFWGFYATLDGAMGANWVHNHQLLLRRTSATKVAVYYTKGKVIFFEKKNGAWQMAAAPIGFVYMGTPYQMVEAGSKLEMMDPQQRVILTFEFTGLANGQVTGVEKVRDRNGNAHAYAYDAQGLLTDVADGLGRTLTFTYKVAAGVSRVETVTDQSGRQVSFTFGATTGRLRSATNGRNLVTDYAYATGSRLAKLTRPGGNVPVSNVYDSNGRCTSQTDGQGNVWSLAYAAGRTTITDPRGKKRVHEFDARLRLVRWTDEAGKSVDLTYDGSDRLVATTDRLGQASSTSYHAESGHVASRTDADGNVWTYSYDAQPQEGFVFYELARIDFPDGTSETLVRDAQGNVLSRTDRGGDGSSFTYNARGQVLTAANPKSGVHAVAYHADGTPSSLTDPAGNVTQLAYDPLFRLAQIARADGATVALAHDERDNLVSRTDENGHVRTFTYDDNDNLVTASNPLGEVTSFGYDGNEDLVSVTDPTGGTARFAWDGLRQLVSRVDRSGDVTSIQYDARRRIEKLVDGAGRSWTMAFDDEGAAAAVTDPLGNSFGFERDGLGRITKTIDPLGHEVTIERDALGRALRVTDPAGRITEFTRDREGLVSRIRTPRADVSARYGRNELDQVRRVTDPRDHAWLTGFDGSGRRTREDDPAGNSAAFAYDARNRVDRITLPGDLGSVRFTQDAGGRLTRARGSDGTEVRLRYDDADRVIDATGITLLRDANGRITGCNGITMTYDADDRVASVTLAPGQWVTYTYDARDLPVQIADWRGGATSFAYLDDGRLASITRPNGTITNYGYDAARRVVSIREERVAGGIAAVLSELELVRDERGQVRRVDRSVPLAEPPAAGVQEFSFDAACQEQSTAYDPLGRVVRNGTRTYTWDLASRLRSYADGDQVVTFHHDAAGSVVSRADAAGTRDFSWNYALALPSISIVREGGRDVRYYVHTPGGLLLHSVEAGTGERRFFHFDQVGSTLFRTDDSGAIVERFAYGPYGEPIAEDGGADNPFTWHGQLGVMRDGGLYNMRARWYDPLSMRFLSRDPIRGDDPIRVNPYQALFGDPVSLVDPMGTDPDGSPGGGRPPDLPAFGSDKYESDAWEMGRVIGLFLLNVLRRPAADAAPPSDEGPALTGPGMSPCYEPSDIAEAVRRNLEFHRRSCEQAGDPSLPPPARSFRVVFDPSKVPVVYFDADLKPKLLFPAQGPIVGPLEPVPTYDSLPQEGRAPADGYLGRCAPFSGDYASPHERGPNSPPLDGLAPLGMPERVGGGTPRDDVPNRNRY